MKHINPDKKQVLTKAVLRAAEHLGLSRIELCNILGFSEATASCIYAHSKLLDPDSKEGELALLFLRMYRSLDALLGGNQKQARDWLRHHNEFAGTIPLEYMQQISGFVDIVLYLDAMLRKKCRNP